MKFSYSTPDSLKAVDLVKRFCIDEVLSEILVKRGITEPEDLRYYLCPQVQMMHNPFLFNDMENVCERILDAAQSGEKVYIFGDRDVDGITSTVLLFEEIRRLGIECMYKLPEGNESYGVNRNAVDAAAEYGATLIITVDCGISSIDEVDYARSLGIDTIILDHHLSGDQAPSAVAIIDPKCEDSGYPFMHLAACGVVAKTIWALRFAQTEYYSQTMVLLHCTQSEKTVTLEAMKLENLVEVSRISEEVVPGLLSASHSRFLDFLNCSAPVFVLDAEYEQSLVKKAFPKGVEISMFDLRPEFEKYMPLVENATLFRLTQVSKAVKFMNSPTELDTLCSLLSAYVKIKNPLLGKDFEKCFDLVAFGTVSDLMPLVNENRVFVKEGLKTASALGRKSLVPFFDRLGLTGKKLAPSDVGWQIAPCINAAGRLGQPDVAAKMLLSTDSRTAGELAEKLIGLNKERQNLSERTWDYLKPIARESLETFGSKIIAAYAPEVPRGIAGVMANRVMKEFRVPSIIITDSGEGTCAGSMRCFGDLNSREFLMRYDDLFSDFGGHKYAGGFSLAQKDVDALLIRISEDAQNMDCPDEDDSVIDIDAVLPPQFFTPELIKTVELFEPYGEENPPLTFLIENGRIEYAEILKNQKGGTGHLKLLVSHGQYKWSCVWWNAADRLNRDFFEGDLVRMAFRLTKNNFRGQETLQLQIVHCESMLRKNH